MELKNQILKLLKEDWEFRKEVKYILEIDDIENEINNMKLKK